MDFGTRYRIEKLLGASGMGKVYKAFDKELSCIIALKTLQPELVSDPTAKRFAFCRGAACSDGRRRTWRPAITRGRPGNGIEQHYLVHGIPSGLLVDRPAGLRRGRRARARIGNRLTCARIFLCGPALPLFHDVCDRPWCGKGRGTHCCRGAIEGPATASRLKL
jgi:serine/threonine protein kinase